MFLINDGFSKAALFLSSDLNRLLFSKVDPQETNLDFNLSSICTYYVPDETKASILLNKIINKLNDSLSLSNKFKNNNFSLMEQLDIYIHEKKYSLKEYFLDNGIRNTQLINLCLMNYCGCYKNKENECFNCNSIFYFRSCLLYSQTFFLILTLFSGTKIEISFKLYEDFKYWINGLELLKKLSSEHSLNKVKDLLSI